MSQGVSERGAHVREKIGGGCPSGARDCVEPSEFSRGNAVDAAALPTGAP